MELNKPSRLILIAALSIIAFALLNIVLAYFSLVAPADSSEFGALRNFSIALVDFMIIFFCLILIFSGLFLLKQKRWAYVLSIIFLVLLMLLLGGSDLKELVFELSPGAALSLNHEILPAVILILLLLSFKSFRKKA